MKTVLGLDLGTNSIGWALVDYNEKKILGMGSRIIPMDEKILGEFGKGNSISQTAKRTDYRSARRLRERHLLRRERLLRVLNVLGFLPEHFAAEIDFEKRLGKFKEETEPKLVWEKNKQEKFEFLFQELFKEMIADFKQSQPKLLNRTNSKGESVKIPYDWTIYYLRKKALDSSITKEQLAWLILNFNQKRGYYQLRGEDDEVVDKKEYVEILKVINIEKGEVDKRNTKKNWYTLTLSNGWTYSATFTSEPLWLNTEKEFLVTEEIDEYGNIKIVKDRQTDTEGKEKRRITPLPSFEEIDLMSKAEQDKIYKKIKVKTELTISNSNKTVGAYIYDTLLQNPTQKINGKLVRTIERKFYKNELRQILQKQIELQPELFSNDLYNDCIHELYRSNKAHQLQLSKHNFVHLILEDIIFYQRPLRSQKSAIGNCALEYRVHKINKKDEKGNPIKNVFETDYNGKEIVVKEYLKAIPKSNPYFQEFRLWQWIQNLSVYKKEDDTNVTVEFLNNIEDYEKLFEFLNNRKEIEQKPLIKYLVDQREQKNQTVLKGKASTTEVEKYRWNYVEDKKYPCNETKTYITTRLEKIINTPAAFLTAEIEYKLWHVIYSVTDKTEFETALETFAKKHGLYYVPKSERDPTNPDKKCFVENFRKIPPFKSEYGSYSEKAIKKLLPFLRLGKSWNKDDVTNEVRTRTNAISERLKTIKEITEIENIADDDIPKQILKSFFGVIDLTQGLRLYQASYLIYGCHSEANDINQWKSVADLGKYMNDFKQHSLRNPIVEQVVLETLRVVKDIWQQYGKGAEKFFDEIHIELGRDMKNTAEDRKKITNQISENENTNLRIKFLLAELKNDSMIENVRPHSPMQQEILKIYEEYAISNDERYDDITKNFIYETVPDDILKISKTPQPTKSELTRYKLWLEQKYRSPYTGQMIPLSKLFTSAYEIEHIIPQSRYFDDSFSNKVICETAVNKIKDNQLGLEFIKKHGGEKIELGEGVSVEICKEEVYISFIKEHYDKNKGKRNKLLLEEIPDKMIERQLNDTRYISKFITSVLANIVRADKDDNGVNSKNIIPGNGKITATLKQDWGLNDIWNELILPRFERMNELTKTEVFTSKNKEGHTIPAVPLELSKGFQKKRIDHRHHALDALVIACATRDHVNLLNNQSAKSDNSRFDLQNKLRNKEKWRDNNGKERDKFTDFKKPWEHFTVQAKNELEKIVVSFKQNLRVINKATNHYEKIENGKKTELEQKGVNWAIRKPMHEETISGIVSLPWLKIGKGEITTATRKTLDKNFNEDKIKKITDTGIQKILINYLKAKDDNPELAFSPEGLEDLNKNIIKYNNGKAHQPIFKVRVYEKGKGRFVLGNTGSKKSKYVQGAPNLFFAIYVDEDGERSFETIPLNIVIERQKQGLNSVPEKNENGAGLCVLCPYLSPNDLVYVPSADELINNALIDFANLTKEQKKRLYNVNDFSSTCYFTPNPIAKAIAAKEVDMNYDTKKNKTTGSFDTKTASLEGKQIKDICIKLKVDRLGNISKA